MRSAGGLIATFTVTPALCAMLLDGRMEEKDTLAGTRHAAASTGRCSSSRWSTASLTLGVLLVLLVGAGLAVRTLGLEFLPKLEEGNMWIRATMPTSISLEAAMVTSTACARSWELTRRSMTVVSQNGRPDDGTDATGFFNAEFFVPLKPFDTWPAGVDKENLTEDMTHRLQDEFPGVDFNFSQYIEDNVEEAASGVKGENSVKLFGNDLEMLEKTANKIKDVMAAVPGIADLAVLRRWVSRLCGSTSTGTGRPLRPGAGRHQRHGAGRRSAARRPAISMRKAATAISRSSCGWRPSIAKAWTRSGTSRSARPIRTAAASCRSRSPMWPMSA